MNQPTILVVDDDPLTRKVVRVALRGEGYGVLEAEDGRTALELTASHSPDLVLQDLVLPDVDGLELVQELRALPGRAELPILAFSGLPSKMERARSLRVGFTAYLVKPLEPSRLIEAVRPYVAPPASIGELPGKGRRLLVVDHDALQRKLLRVHATRLGFDVAAAEDRVDALDQARRWRPDAIVSDVLMPHLDGFRLCVAVRQDPDLAGIPLILTSAEFIAEADRELAREAGATAFMPLTPGFQDVVQALLASLDAIPEAPPPVSLPEVRYADRLAEQLGRQTGRGNELSQRLAWLEAKLAILATLSDTLKRTGPAEPLVDEMLYRALDACGAPCGAAYLLEADGSLSLRVHVRFDEEGAGRLSNFFGYGDLLLDVMEGREPLEIPSSRVPADRSEPLLRLAGAESILIAPLISGEERLGALAMAWPGDSHWEGWRFFATAVASQVSQATALAHALSQLRESEERQALLARAGSLLAESLDHETTLGSIATLAVPQVADWCSVDEVGEDGSIRWLAVARSNPRDSGWAEELRRRYPADLKASWGPARVIHTGRAEFYSTVGEPSGALGPNGALSPPRIFQDAGLGLVMILPLVAHGRTLGAVTFASLRSRRLRGRSDLCLAEELARLYALALDSSRLFEQAQDALKMRDEFLSVAAHELKTPVTSLWGFAQLALRQLDRTGPPDRAQMGRAFNVIERQARRLSHLVSQLLDISRIQAGKLMIEPRPVDVVALVEGVVATMSVGAIEHNLAVRAVSPARTMADPLRLEQVITNLIDNAIKYSPEGGQIDVEVETVDAEAVRIAVRDQGIGIPLERVPYIFDRFYRAHSGQPGGMGLGLYISRHIVELHGGSIDVECPPDGGSRFIVRLPNGAMSSPA